MTAEVVAAIATDPVATLASLVDRATERAGLWVRLDAQCSGERAEFEVLVLASPAAAIPVFDALVDLVHERGYHRICVAGRPDLTGVTPAGGKYRLVDLGEDVVPADFPETSVLHGTGLANAWLGAGFRLHLAVGTTHPEYGFAMAVAGMLNTLPASDQHQAYRARRDDADVLVDLLTTHPADFHLVDVTAGAATVLACPDPVLLDVLGAILVGEDPAASPVTAAALDRIGLPADYVVAGELAAAPGWRRLPHALVSGMRQLRPEGPLHRLFTFAADESEVDRYAMTDRLLAGLTRLLARWVRHAGTDPAAARALYALMTGASAADLLQSAWQVIFAKDSFRRRDVSLGIDLPAFGPADYDTVPVRLAGTERLIEALRPDRFGMRWAQVDGAVLFGCDRVVNAPYAEFVRRVEIDRVVSFMDDYVGGRLHVTGRDKHGRPTRQAERNLYLPQPNFLALLGGDTIDVCKLEAVRYRPDSQKISWRTVFSPNGSAECDDGSVAFRSAEAGTATLVSIRTRQKFVLPRFALLLGLDRERVEGVRARLISDAYHRFFAATVDNLEARYEGREFRIAGLSEKDTGADGPGPPLLTARAEALYEFVKDALADLTRTDLPDPARIDDQGFRHFSPATTAPPRSGLVTEIGDKILPRLREFLGGLRAAAERDAEAGRPEPRAWLEKYR